MEDKKVVIKLDIEAIIDMYKSGNTLSQIAEHFNVSHARIQYALRPFSNEQWYLEGAAKNRTKKYTPEKGKRIYQLRKQNYPISACAEIMSVNNTTARKWVDKYCTDNNLEDPYQPDWRK